MQETLLHPAVVFVANAIKAVASGCVLVIYVVVGGAEDCTGMDVGCGTQPPNRCGQWSVLATCLGRQREGLEVMGRADWPGLGRAA